MNFHVKYKNMRKMNNERTSWFSNKFSLAADKEIVILDNTNAIDN